MTAASHCSRRVIPVPDGSGRLALASLPSLATSPAGGTKMPSRAHPRVSFQGSFIKNSEILAGEALYFSAGGKVESYLCRLTWFLGVCQELL